MTAPAATPSAAAAWARRLALLAAVAGPLLLNQPLLPLASHPAQIAAVFGWGLVLMLVPAPTLTRRTLRGVAPLLAAIALAGGGCALSMAVGGYPASPGLATLGLIALVALVALHGAAWGASDPHPVFRAFAIALVVAGLCGALLAIVQIFVPGACGGLWVAIPSSPGRASGNVGQANHFADTLLWGLPALAALVPPCTARDRRLHALRAAAAAALCLLVFGIVLSGSRTALLGVLMLGAWAFLARGLDRGTRRALMAAPLLAGVLVVALRWWANAHAVELLLLERGADPITFRGVIWHDSLVLVAQQPWLGVGWGHYNLAWSLTPFAIRPAGLVDNAHDLPLQLAVELGIPATLAIVGLLAGAAGYAARRLRSLAPATRTPVRAALMMVAVVGLHSLFEYPLWYAYLALPAAWAAGLALGAAAQVGQGAGAPVEPNAARRAWQAAGLLVVVVGASAWQDYRNVADLYATPVSDPSFQERLRNERASPLFSALADRLVALRAGGGEPDPAALARASQVLLDPALMQAWADQLAAQGESDKARYLAARLREFGPAASQRWFAPCARLSADAPSYRCLPPSRAYSWRDFR